MNLFLLSRRWYRLSAPGALLLMLLQRTPVLRVLSQGETLVASSSAAAIVRSVFAIGASLGAMHTLAGATQFVQTPAGTIEAKVGTEVQVAFTYNGTPTPPASFTITAGALPPGLSFVPAPVGKVINSGTPAISGTPTQAGSYSVSVQGFNATGGTGNTNGISQMIRFEITASTTDTAPSITTQPQNQTVNVGASASFSVAASGSPAPTYQWRKDGADLSGATAATLSLQNVQTTQAGKYTVVVTNSAGSVTSNEATLTVNTPGGNAPTFTLQPTSVTASSGSSVALNALATGATGYRWQRNGADVPGGSGATLQLSNVSAAQAGNYTVIASNGGGNTTSSVATLTVVNVGAADRGRITNLSVRTFSGNGAQVLNVGFAVGGDGTSGNKSLLVRVVGPTLATLGVGGTMVDPTLTVAPLGVSTPLVTNDDWSTNPGAVNANIGFPLLPGGKDAAAVATVAAGGTYSALAEGKSSGTGIVLTELYDMTDAGSITATTPRLVNVSARAQAGTGDGVLIAGFFIGGSTAKTVLIRAIGPTLGSLGVAGALADPKLEIYADQQKLYENDNWGGAALLTNVGNSVFAFPITDGNSKDAMLLVTLPPGGYTAQVSGVGGLTGVALVEVYEVP